MLERTLWSFIFLNFFWSWPTSRPPKIPISKIRKNEKLVIFAYKNMKLDQLQKKFFIIKRDLVSSCNFPQDHFPPSSIIVQIGQYWKNRFSKKKNFWLFFSKIHIWPMKLPNFKKLQKLVNLAYTYILGSQITFFDSGS